MPAPIGTDATRVTAGSHRVAVEIDVSTIAQRLEAEALRLIKQFSQQGLEGQALADAVSEGLRQLSDAPITKASRGATSEAFNLGRNLVAQEKEAEIEQVVRTEILDASTCAPCRALDFSISKKVYTVNTPEYFEFMPPNKCNGRELCRGFYIYLKEAA